MKIITDFDGTLTSIQYEFQLQRDILFNIFKEIFGSDIEIFQKLWDHASAVVEINSADYGWLNNGRISAYSDEDLFINLSSTVTWIENWLKTDEAGYEAVRERLKDQDYPFSHHAEKSHQEIDCAELSAFNCPEPGAVSTINTLLDQDCEVVVVSNSPASRIIEKLDTVGLKPVDHEDNPSARFRVRGHANKFVLDDQPENIEINGRIVDVARSSYRDIIEQERPQAIIGDVFSLDLALPQAMCVASPNLYEGMQLYLRTRTYTPQWAINCILEPQIKSVASLRLLNHFSDLPDLLRKR